MFILLVLSNTTPRERGVQIFRNRKRNSKATDFVVSSSMVIIYQRMASKENWKTKRHGKAPPMGKDDIHACSEGKTRTRKKDEKVALLFLLTSH